MGKLIALQMCANCKMACEKSDAFGLRRAPGSRRAFTRTDARGL